MGSGGNVGRAIYARDLSRDKSRGEYVCAHTFPAERTHALARGGITRRRRNRIYVRVARLASTDHPFFSFTPPPPPPPRSRGWSRRFPREQSFDPAYLLAASSIFPSPVRNSYTSAREHACNLPRFQKRVRKPARVVSAGLEGNSFVIPFAEYAIWELTKRREKKMGAIKRYVIWGTRNLGRFRDDRSSNAVPSCEPHFPARETR